MRQALITAEATGAQTKAADYMKYDAASHQFIYNWKLGKSGVGTATISVSISYSGTTTKPTKSEQITITS